MASRSCLLYAFLVLFLLAFEPTSRVKATDIPPPSCRRVVGSSAELIQFGMNFLLSQAEFFNCAATGEGINVIAPDLVQGGPVSIGCTRANLNNVTRAIFAELGFLSVGLIRFILQASRLINPIPVPQIDISTVTLGGFANAAFGANLRPPFNIYANTINILPGSAAFLSLTRQYYIGISPYIVGDELQAVVSSIVSAQSAAFGVIRTLQYQNENVTMVSYNFNIATYVDRLAQLINRLAMCGDKDEGLKLQFQFGTTTNIIPFTPNVTAASRTALELLRVFYGTGNASLPGAIFPQGVNGRIAEKIVNLKLN
ncbi:hypothetical protein CCACVL1_22271 [Corchorus capsularis]|uniref:Uncharacterized protein n=1 Tax=Corchorus capsularis TaxID=210143 RepID=A0A1R3H0B4_COCAP|nr:hypothetical protein CCACVL1_22271 [Corchorus capsularis]